MKRIASNSLKVLVPASVLVFAAILCALDLLYHVPQAELAVENEARTLTFQDLSRLQSSVEYQLQKGDVEDARREVAVLSFNHNYTVAALVDDSGRVIAATRRAWMQRLATDVLPNVDQREVMQAVRDRRARITLASNRQSLLAYAAVQLASNARELRSSRFGWLFFEYDLRLTKARVRNQMVGQSLLRAVWVTGLALLLAIVFHFLLTRRTDRLVQAAEQLAAGNLEARSALRGRDELARLSQAFDVMARTVEETQTRLRIDVAERIRTETLLRASEASYRGIFEASEDAIVVFAIDSGAIIDANRRACVRYAFTLDEMHRIDIATLSARSQSGSTQELGQSFRTASRGEPVHMEWHYRRRDGNSSWDEVHFKRVTIGGHVRVLALTRDISEQKLAAKELSRQRETLFQHEKLAALGSLLAGVAHELNNPLAVVVARAVMLEERNDPAIRASVASIRTAAERCARIVRTFLAMARRQPAERTAVHINKTVSAALDLTRQALRESQIDVDLLLASNLPIITADADQLHQVLVNLIINAHQALQHHPEPRRLALHSRFDTVAAEIQIQIVDNGPGIPETLLPRIFEPYFTTKPICEGTGVGLTVSQGIVEAHGGTLSASCAIKGGSVFTIILPVGKTMDVKKTQGKHPVMLPGS